MDGRALAAGLVGIVMVLAVAWVEGVVRRHWAGWASGGGSYRLLRRMGVSLALVVMLSTGTLAQLGQAGIGLAPMAQAQGLATGTGNGGGVNRFDPHMGTTSVAPRLPKYGPVNNTPRPQQFITHPAPLPMKTGLLALAAGAASRFVGSDGRLELDVPAGAVTAADVASAGGKLGLRIEQIAPASGSTAGGSGSISFGTYLIQVVDASGVLVTHGLRQPVALKLHLGAGDGAADVSHVLAVFNGGLPLGVDVAPTAATAATAVPARSAGPAPQGGVPVDTAPAVVTPASIGLGAYHTQKAVLDAGARTLSVSAALQDPSTSMSFNTDTPVAAFGKPDPFTVDLSGGGLNGSIPIDVPSGPGGLTPPVALTYSSAGVAEQHNPQAAAGWAGEGWNLSLGAISWAEHNVTSNCPTTCGPTWEDSWQLSDPFGTAAELIPPNINVATYHDDSPNGITPSPVQWYTAPDTHAKIYSYVGPVNPPDSGGAHAPCFRVFLANGIMEEFGCTADSLEYYYTPGWGDYISSWNLDLITDPRGNQIHITYQQDVEQKNVGGVNHTYIRDAVPSSIQWDSPTCLNAQAACSGSAWQPRLQVSFNAGHSVSYPLNTPVGCNTGTNLRCDDALDLSGNGQLAAPDVQSTFVLNDVYVQANTSTAGGGTYTSGAWNLLKHYKLSYEQSAPTTFTDPVTGKSESASGKLLLEQLVTLGDDDATALPTRTFGYSGQDEYYEDAVYHPATAAACGPPWNTGNGSGCVLWATTHENNRYFLASASNGMGLQQSFVWTNALNNTHGVNGGGAGTSDPTFCYAAQGVNQSVYPCDEASDQNWSRTVLTSQTDAYTQANSAGNQPVTSTTSYSYALAYPLQAQECPDCKAGMYWGNQNDGDYLDYYNAKFFGFAQTTVWNPDGSKDVHTFETTSGYGVYDTSQVTVCYSNQGGQCHSSPYWAVNNLAHGRETELDRYDAPDGTTLLSKTLTTYAALCPTPGTSGTPASSQYGNWDGNLVSELDHNNPVAACAVQTTRTETQTYNGSPGPGYVDTATTSTQSFDGGGHLQSEAATTTVNGGTEGSLTSVVHTTSYEWNDAVSATSTGATGTYLVEVPHWTDTEDAAGNGTSCTSYAYDNADWGGGQRSGLLTGQPTAVFHYPTACGTAANNWTSSTPYYTTTDYDQYGNRIATSDADANAGIAGHLGCQQNGTSYSACADIDSTYVALPTWSGNALGQWTQTSYRADASGGWGLWPTVRTDSNGQATSYGYDALGRMTARVLPGDSATSPTTTWSYTDWCSATGAQTPCVEIDQTQRLSSSETVTTRAFYDGDGHLVETRSPGPGGQDVVQYSDYDTLGRQTFQSNRYFVPAYSGGPGASAFATPDANQPGTTTQYANQRTTNVMDPTGAGTLSSRWVACGWYGDSGCYDAMTVYDPLGHQSITLTDGWGREAYTDAYSGTGTSSNPYVRYAQTAFGYNTNGNLVTMRHTNATTQTFFRYNLLGRLTGMTDPDRGTESYSYDPDGNRVQSTDGRGISTYASYDGLDRQVWRNTTNSSSGAYVTYSYDSTANGNLGVGHLTGETFNGGTALGAGSYAYTYDARGQQAQQTITLGGSAATFTTAYDDSGQQTSLTYPDGELLSLGRDAASGWLTSAVTTPSGGSTSTLLTNISYSGLAGAAQQPTGASVAGGTYSYSASYDADLRLTNTSLTRASDTATLFGSSRSYDAVGNVTSVNTTLAAGTDHQAFCYDEQNRLTWAGSAGGTTPCGGTNTAGTLTNAQYTQSFSYDNMGRLTSGPLGSYTYGDAAHVHAATSIGSGSMQYTASYDAAGDMLCRAPTGATTCAGSSPTGAQLTYDAEGRLIGWQNAPGSSPTSTASFAYDGEGHRVAQVSSSSPTTYYLGSWEEITGSTVTKYYPVGAGLPQPVKVGTTLSYLATDGLGSVSEAVDGSGNVLAQQLYAPYGGLRYSSGTLPTSKGFTGQRADVATGLDYYNARYYDSLAGQFTSADTVLDGLNRYAYVGDNPETKIDQDGHCWPFCAIVAAVAVAVVATVVDVAVQAVQNNGDLSKTDWGTALKVGAVAGVATGAVLLAGPLIAEATAGEGLAAAGANPVATYLSARAGTAAATGLAGGIMGGVDGLTTGLASGHTGWRLAADVGIGGLTGAATGIVSGFIPGPTFIAGAVSNGMANLAGQAMNATVDHRGRFDPRSFVVASVWGAASGAAYAGLTISNWGQILGQSAFSFGGDATSQLGNGWYERHFGDGGGGSSGSSSRESCHRQCAQ